MTGAERIGIRVVHSTEYQVRHMAEKCSSARRIRLACVASFCFLYVLRQVMLFGDQHVRGGVRALARLPMARHHGLPNYAKWLQDVIPEGIRPDANRWIDGSRRKSLDL
jgi:hypothetical protein